MSALSKQFTKKKRKMPPFDLKKEAFGAQFYWGVSTAAYQIEGAYDKDGKSPSIWDTFTARKGKIYKGQNGQVATDFYHLYEKDIALLASMGIPNFRFSIAWSRILPEGTGQVNQDGIDFYNRVIDCCLEYGVTPWVTIYHWDLPEVLEKKGGWATREILNWFQEFVYVCARNFGDRVRHWMVLNEPMVFTGAGYFLGVHAPGRKGLRNFLPTIHHVVLCQALGGRILKAEVKDAMIGTTFSCSYVEPYTQKKKDVAAAKRADLLLNRLFIEPALGLGYPMEGLKVLRRLKKYIHKGDMERAVFDFDFIGIQNYTREVVAHSWFVPYIKAKIIPTAKRNVKTTLMGWEVYPGSIYKMLQKYQAYEGVQKLIITENGAAFKDQILQNEVQDVDRLKYIQEYLQQVYRAKKEGVAVQGYFVWTFTDNFEWAEGFYPRFGLVHVDFRTQKRTIKASGKWWSKFLKSTIHKETT